ncbi:MAG: TonB family protein [Candidatus Omnitrophica bacterium]|nr:TonB family protein [Candidatus Omnitrophota bacterium]
MRKTLKIPSLICYATVIWLVLSTGIPYLFAAHTTSPYDQFMQIINERVQFFLIYPQQESEKGHEGVVQVKFTIRRDGRVEKLEIAQSSGYPLLDKAALWAVQNAAPFPSPGSFYLEEKDMTIILPLTFKTVHQKKPAPPESPIPLVPLPTLLPQDTPEEGKPLKKAYFLSDEDIMNIEDEEDEEEQKPLTPAEQKKNAYITQVQDIVNFYTFYPEELDKEKIKAQTVVHTTIGQDGKTKGTLIAQSSGFEILDRAALFILEAAQPFPPPRNMGTDEVTIALPISFSPLEEEAPAAPIPKIYVPGEEEASQEILLADTTSDMRLLFQIAKENSYPLRVAENQIVLAQSKVREALRNMFPFVNLEYSMTEGETIAEPYESKSYGVRGQHILWDNAQRKNSLHKEKLNVDVSKDNYEKIKQQILYDVAKAYYLYQKEKQSLEVLKRYQKKFERYSEIGDSLEKGELITTIEALKIQNFAQRLETELLAQNNLYQLTLTNLKKVLGMDHTELLPVLKDVKFKHTYKFDQPIEEVIDLGLARRPEIAIWDQSVKATELGYRATKAESKPKILLDGFWGQSGESFGEQSLELGTNWAITTRMVWLLGENSMEASYVTEKSIPTDFSQVSNKTSADTLGFKLNILDKFQYTTEVEEGKVALKQVADEFSKIKRDIAWEIKEAYLTYSETMRRLKSIKKELETTHKEVELKRQLFKLGEASLSDVMEIETKQLSDELNLVKTGSTLYLSLITLDKATAFNLNILEGL